MLMEGLSVVEKRRLEFHPVFPYHRQMFKICGPKTHDDITMEQKEREQLAIGE